MNRRKLLATLTTGAGVAAAGAAVWPLAAAATDTSRDAAPAEAPWIDAGDERDLRPGVPIKAALRAPVRDGFFTTLQDLGAAWVIRAPQGVVALSATCPHLGCSVVPRADALPGFACPCHDSRFRPDGELEKGPAARGMDPLPVRIVDGRVQVQAIRFAPAISTRRRV